MNAEAIPRFWGACKLHGTIATLDMKDFHIVQQAKIKFQGSFCHLLRPLINHPFFIGSFWLYYNKIQKNPKEMTALMPHPDSRRGRAATS